MKTVVVKFDTNDHAKYAQALVKSLCDAESVVKGNVLEIRATREQINELDAELQTLQPAINRLCSIVALAPWIWNHYEDVIE